MLDSSIVVFIATSMLIILSPGQDMVLVLSHSIARGSSAGVITAAGVGTGLLGHTVLAGLGLGALLQASELAFSIMKYAGAAYMLYLGIKAFRARPIDLASSPQAKGTPRSFFLRGGLSNISNPKVAIFYFAYLPQFVKADNTHPTETLLALGATFALLTFMVKMPIGYFAGTLSGKIQSRPTIQAWLNRACGGVLIAMGLRLATEGQTGT